MAKPKEIKKIKSGLFSRGLAVAKMGIATGTSIAAQGVVNLLADEDLKKKNWRQLINKRAQALATEVGSLKGSLMKAGQMLSMYGDYFLPEEATAVLKSLQSDSAPVAWTEIQDILHKQLTKKQLSELEIDPAPIGTASLAQVHRATVKSSGQQIVLKIQYPGLQSAMDSDLRALKGLFAMMKILPPDFNTEALFTELRKMLEQELDYQNEILQTKAYAKRLHKDSRYIVPQIIDEYCGERIIASTFEEGVRIDESAVQNLSNQRREKIATNFLELYFKELFVWGVVQTDPHFGNYRVRLNEHGEDQLVLFDFGAVRSYPKKFLHAYYRMLSALLENDRELLQSAAEELRFLQSDDEPELINAFLDFCETTVEPFLDPKDPRRNASLMDSSGIYDWGKSDLPQRLTKKGFQMVRSFHLRSPPTEIIFLDRKTGGVFIVLAKLGAKLKARELMQGYLKESLR